MIVFGQDPDNLEYTYRFEGKMDREKGYRFDPGKYMEQFTPEDPSRNVGLRIIAGIAKEISYQNNAGINTLLIKV